MKSGIIYEQGDIVLIPYPFTDLSGIKKRPVLVLSTKSYNSETEDFIVCGITSAIKDTRYSVLIDNKSLESGFIPKPSRIKVDKIFTLKQSLTIKKIGELKKEVMENVKKELMKFI